MSWREFSFLPGVVESLADFKKSNYNIFIVSNQACVAKGLMSKQELLDLTENMLKEISRQGAFIDGVYYCIHQDSDNCPFRKPSAGMINRVFEDAGLGPDERQEVFFIGDSIRDVQTAKNAGIKSLLVFSGQESLENKSNWHLQPDAWAQDLTAAKDYILKNNG